ncbi:hypothetical protein Tco_1153544 [Tanacetum coccineum]
MVISSPCLIDNKELTSPEQTAPALASPKQTALGKDSSNPLLAGSLPKTTLCVSLSAEASTDDNGEVMINVYYDGHSLSSRRIFRKTSKLADQDWVLFHLQWRYAGFMKRHQFQNTIDLSYSLYLAESALNNMKRQQKGLFREGFSGQEVALFPNMLDVTEPSTSPSRITCSHSPTPSPSPEPTPAYTPSPT